MIKTVLTSHLQALHTENVKQACLYFLVHNGRTMFLLQSSCPNIIKFSVEPCKIFSYDCKYVVRLHM